MSNEKPTDNTAQDSEPLTEELLEELLESPSAMDFIAANGIGERSLSEYLNSLLDEKGLRRSDVIRKAGINETFGYQIFTGQRGASRNKALQLAFAMGLTLRQTNRLLRAAGANELYAKSRRDAIILFCLDRGDSLQNTNEQLYAFGEDTIC